MYLLKKKNPRIRDVQFKPDLFKGHLHITAGERGGVCGQDPSLPAADGGRLRTPPRLESAGPCLWRTRSFSLLHLGIRRYLLIIKK